MDRGVTSGAAGTADRTVDRDAVQRRVRRGLAASQVFSGIGIGAGLSVVALLAFELSGSEALSGVSPTAAVFGTATAAMAISSTTGRGRRPGLVGGNLAGALGAALAVAAAVIGSFPLHVVASILFGSGWAANLQSRFAATDLSTPERRGRDLSVVVWATTIGAVLGPNLTGPGGDLAVRIGVPPLAGPYVIAAVAFAIAAVLASVALRPDPLLIARGATPERPHRPVGRRGAWAAVRASTDASVAVVAIAAAHAVMVGVMALTPVHMGHFGADLRIVGLTISLHIAGMYALSPWVGRLTDRLGRRPVILLGLAQLAVGSLTAAGATPGGVDPFTGGLVLLGTGWSFCLVAGSALLTDAVEADARPAVQGLSDLIMNVAGGTATIVAGVTFGLAGFPTMAVGALLLLIVPAWRLLVPMLGGRRAVA
jgi:MFS family permease